ncbi:MAG: S1C family serine protease [Geminicoccaceae bacterium]
MAESQDWEIPTQAQPKAGDLAFDLDRTLESVVTLRAEVPEDAFTAAALGTQRLGNAVLIRDSGLLLTIGYLVTEAERIWLSTGKTAVQGTVVAYDFATGFGLVQALGRLGVPAIPLGSSSSLRVGDPLVVAGHGGRSGALSARLVSRREFAGYWEYLLDEALFTTPAHPHWGGAACIDRDGKLVGIGSLLVQEASIAGQQTPGNMIVPIDLLPPILPDLERFGRANRPPRPWLGVYVAEGPGGEIVVTGLAANGPAAQAGLRPADVIVEIDGLPVGGLADLYRQLWSAGEAGVGVGLAILRDGNRRTVTVRTTTRESMLRRPRSH